MKRLAIIGNQAYSMLNFRGDLIKEAIEHGHVVYALAPDYDMRTRAAIEALGAIPIDHRLARTGMNPLQDLAALAGLVQILRARRPDVVLAYSVKPVVFGVAAAWIAGVPARYAMIEGLGHVFMETKSLRKLLLRLLVSLLYRFSLAHSRRVLFLNGDDLAEFVSAGMVVPDKATVIGAIGVPLDRWPLMPPVTDPVTFLFVGRLLREKGILELVQAMRLIKLQDSDARLIVLGDVDSNPSSFRREDVQSWVDEGLLTWPGHVDVRPWLSRSSVFVLPSYREGVPRSTQEAMASGRAIITTDVPGCRETVHDGKNGFLVRPRDAQSLAAAMLKFIDDRALIESMGRESRSMAEIRFDAQKATAALLESIELTSS